MPASFAFTRSARREFVEEISLSPRKRRSNLPAQVTSFIGRESQIAKLTDWVRKTRLLTLTGAGGCGKTRLSLEVAPQMQDEFADGEWLVEFAPLSDASLVPRTVAGVFSLSDVVGTPLIETLVNYLGSKHLLLVLDNCEHLIEACAQLTERLLRDCPNIHLLATRRCARRSPGALTCSHQQSVIYWRGFRYSWVDSLPKPQRRSSINPTPSICCRAW